MVRKEPLPPADKRYAPSDQARQIADRLIRKYPVKFGELTTAHVGYFTYAGGLRRGGERRAARIATCTGFRKFLSRCPENEMEGWDYLLILCAETWTKAGKELRERIVFRELRKALRAESKTTGESVWKLLPYEFEGFYDEYEIYGDDRELRQLLGSFDRSDEEEAGE